MEAKLKSFNILNVFKISTSETAISAFLSWIMNPNEDHGCGDYFLKYFLIECAKISGDFSVINIDGLNLNNAMVKTEENFYGKKADITIRIDPDKFLCLIENKVKSSESEGQTEKYVEYSKKKYDNYNFMYIYLTPSGITAESIEFISISYQEIRSILLQTIKAKETILNEEIIILLKQFIKNLEVNILDEGEIPDLCREIYERHKEAIEKIISYRPEFIKIIENEILNLLNNEWKAHSTKNACSIFKKDWLNKFEEFFTPRRPFFYYLILSYDKEGLCIDISLYINEDKNKGGKIGLRNKFIEILDVEIKNNPPIYYQYLEKNKAVKFRKVALENGYESSEDLRNVATEMKKIIDDTLIPIENAIKNFLEKYHDELNELKEQLKR